jgi:hypothetical protein
MKTTMKQWYLFLVILACLTSACASTGKASSPHPTPTYHPTPTMQPRPSMQPTVILPTLVPTPTTPVLQPYYLYSSSTTLIFLDFADETSNRASTTSQLNWQGQPCLMTYESRMWYEQSGNQFIIHSLYVGGNPFILNNDGTLTTNETDLSTGQIIVETFQPSSIQAYNAALLQLQKQMAHC